MGEVLTRVPFLQIVDDKVVQFTARDESELPPKMLGTQRGRTQARYQSAHHQRRPNWHK